MSEGVEGSAWLHFDDWAGRRRDPVVVVGETPQRYRIRAAAGRCQRLAGRAGSIAGDETALVPKRAVTSRPPNRGESEWWVWAPGGYRWSIDKPGPHPAEVS